MALIKDLKHYNDIFWLLYKYGQTDIFKEFSKDIDLPKILKERGDEKGKAEDLVKDLESLGPFYIKLGQILSAEAQMLPPEYDEALQKLQDKATPMPFREVKSIITEELGQAPNKIFHKFNPEPLSAASLGQVHLAELVDGKKVAVKVQRKDIQDDIVSLLEAVEKICQFLEERTIWGKKFHIIEKFQHLRTILLNELDYTKEAENLKMLNKNMSDFEHLIVPLPIDSLTTARVLTMDYVRGVRVTELSPLEKIDMGTEQLAEELFQGYLKQILIDGFFQMDPHPGNIYLTVIDDTPYLAIFDLGMVAHIPFQMQGRLIRCLFAMTEGRELEVTKIMATLGKRLDDFDEYFLRTKIADIVGQYRSVTLSQMPVGRIVLKLARIAAESGLWLPIQFSTIGKTLLSIDPVLKALNPNFRPNSALHNAAPDLLKKNLARQFSYQAFYGTFLEGLEFFQRLPGQLSEVFDLIVHNDYHLKVHFLESESISRNVEKIANRITTGLILASLLISAALLMDVDTPFKLFGYPGFAMVMFLLATLGSLLLIFSILWSDRKK